jgi:hypothetical protein
MLDAPLHLLEAGGMGDAAARSVQSSACKRSRRLLPTAVSKAELAIGSTAPFCQESQPSPFVD